MGAPIKLRVDYDGDGLRVLAKGSADAGQTRRLLALAVIYDGGKRSAAARLGGVGLQVVRDQVLRFNALGPAGLVDRKAPGQPPKLDAAQRRELAEKVERGPIPAVDGVVRWRLKDLARWIFEDFGIAMDCSTVGRLLRSEGFRKLTARPKHPAQPPDAIADFKKVSRPR